MEERKCGECQICCTVLGVPSIDNNKPEWTVCSQQFEGGCRIYEKRPEECKVFTCSWIQGVGGNDERPDRLGAMFRASHSDKLGGYWVTVHILEENIKKNPKVRAHIFEYISRCVVVEVTKNGGHRLLGGPPEQVALFAKHKKDFIPTDSLIPASSLLRKINIK